MRSRAPYNLAAVLLCAAAVCGAVSGAYAQAPGRHVTLKLDHASSTEAIRRLAEASGVLLDGRAAPSFIGAPAPPETPESFDWKDVPFAQALRQLCHAYNLAAGRRAGGYTLFHVPDVTPPPPRRVGRFESGGVRLFARSVTVTGETRALNFEGGDADEVDGSLTLNLGGELGDREADSIAGMEHVTARDDTGTVLRRPDDTADPLQTPNMFPDEWSSTLQLSAPGARARKLLYVQGDLMAYRTYRRVLVEIPWSAVPQGAHREVGAWSVGVWDYQPKYQPPHTNEVVNQPANPALDGPSIHADVAFPLDSTIRWQGQGSDPLPVVVGASGKAYRAEIVSSTGGDDGQAAHYSFTLVFPGLNEDGRLVWEVTEKADPVKLLTFRLENVPLPQPRHAPGGEAVALPAGDPAAAGAAPAHPFFQRGGGALHTRVLVGEQPAAGMLRLGLSAKDGAGWGPVRWLELEVGPDGEARVADLKPGAYRVTRTFMASDHPPSGGAWLGRDAGLTIAAGKEAELPPLRWSNAKAPAPRPVKTVH